MVAFTTVFCALLACASGEGDCDSNSECRTGLVCGRDNGPKFGYGDTWDFCVPEHCTNRVWDQGETSVDCGGECGAEGACNTCPENGATATCTPGCPCTFGWGDCDADVDCGAGLVCGKDNGPMFGMGVTFDVCVPPDFQTLKPYWGNLHSHTRYSDGEMWPSDAYSYAREVGGLDFLAVTDHLEKLWYKFATPTYSACHAQANAADDPGSFVAVCGFEYGLGYNSTGHANVFGSPVLFPAYQYDYHDFYSTLVTCGTCVGAFNHPADELYQTWNSWEYRPDVDARIQQFEFNGDNKSEWDVYFNALDAGWRVSPSWNQDNHDPDWGTKTEARTGIWAHELTREALLDALALRRTFATNDSDAWVWVQTDTADMGSIVSPGYTTITVLAHDPTDPIATVSLYTNARVSLASSVCYSHACVVNWRVRASANSYYVVRIDEMDGDFLVPAPIWVED